MGNVKIQQPGSWLHSQKVIVYFDDNNKTKMYEASGAVEFEFKNEKNFYKGSAQIVKYYPQKSYYELQGKAVIDDLANKRHIDGDMITLDIRTGHADVKGNKAKPVKFIFDLEEGK